MMKKMLIMTLSVFMVFSFAACKKKEQEPPVPQGQMPPQG